MKRRANKPRILVCGLPFPSVELSGWLRKNGIEARAGKTRDLFLGVTRYDIAHFVYSPTIRLRALFLFPFLKLLRRKTVVHWIGSDVLSVLTRRKPRFITRAVSSLIDRNLAQSQWLRDELTEVNIFAEHISIVPNISIFRPLELPNRTTVLAYIPAQRPDFYGGSIILRLAKEFPAVTFLVVASAERKSTFDNVEYLGYVPHDSMSRLYKRATVLIRMPKHDGLPFMVLEALSYGRYVIYNRPFPNCIYAETHDGARQALAGLLHVDKPNQEGALFARSYIRASVIGILRVYESLFRHRE